ncbi:hypothetical protein B5S31_g3754 [[Candida] boidinii]|nr:hypothetical protein B5S29_g3971 [[Candida] boidinii]OWB73984.1 hypothetical protein B5S31_g3754 [[Candida] boidinii]
MSSITDNNQNLIKNSDIPVESSSSSSSTTTTTSDKENGPIAPVSQTKESETTTTATTTTATTPQTINSKSDKPTTTPSTTAKNTTTTRRRKKKVGMACVYCRRSHMICDEGRPCQRCMKRKIGHLCHDEPASTKTRKKQKKENGSIESDNNNDENSGDEDTEQSTEPEPVIPSSSTSTATVPETTVSETTTTTTTTSPNSLIRQKLGAPLKMGATFDVKFYNEATENSNNQGIREYSDNKDFRNYTNERGAFTTETDESTSNTEISTQQQQQQQQQPEPNNNNNNNNNNSNNSQQNNINKTTGFSNTNSKVHLNQYNGMNNNNNNNNNSNFYNKSATGSVPQSSTSLNQQPFFYSEHAGSEFNSLTEFLSMIDDTDMINSINLNNDPMLAKLENATSSQLGSYNNSSTNLHTQFLEQTGMAPNNNMNGHNNENINSNNNNNNNSNNNGNSRTNNKSNISNSVLSSMGFTVPSSTNINQFNNMYKTPNDSTSNFIQPSLPPLQQHQNVDQMQPHQQLQRMDLHQSSSNNMLIQSPYVGRQQQSQQQQQQQQQLPYDRHSVNNRQLQIHNSNNNSTTNFSSQTSQSQSQSHNQTPVISDAARDKFFLTAADPTTEVSPEERLKQVISAKLEAGLLKPYNYAKGYARLQTYMDNHMNASSRQRILKPLSTFRPGFRAIAKTLKDIDLILVEEAFERMLLDYDRVFTSMAIPACLWRRTGEIYRGNKEFASLVEVSIDDLKNGKLTIYELMSEESSVNFWEKYGSIAFDKTQKAVLTSCNLKSKDGRKKKNCCFSFTIRRDRYNIPSCIVGNFIPISN